MSFGHHLKKIKK
jgi:Dynamin family